MSDRLGKPLRVASIFLLLSLGCGDPQEPSSQGSDPRMPPVEEGDFVESVYERNFVFASLEQDSVFIVPWLMETTEMPDSVLREAEGWIARGGVWDRFYAERWWTPPTRAPGRILPYPGLGILVSDEGAVDGIVFEDPPRSLEIILGEGGTPWTGARGGSFQVLEGSAYLADQRIDGRVLDMARATAGDRSAGGDWAFLLAGDSAHFVLAADEEHGGETEPRYRAWGTLGEENVQWPEVRLAWSRTEAFPPARRDVPVEWDVSSSDGSMQGALEALSAEIQPGDGPGPLLPVRALYEVVGELSTADGTFPVHGIVVHQRR
ncbi:MAG: hypothetical protein R3304_00165 [Longimicrobiales bacterium]|nr:hypothetical protein [Longimicrobiales bacterium]